MNSGGVAKPGAPLMALREMGLVIIATVVLGLGTWWGVWGGALVAERASLKAELQARAGVPLAAGRASPAIGVPVGPEVSTVSTLELLGRALEPLQGAELLALTPIEVGAEWRNDIAGSLPGGRSVKQRELAHRLRFKVNHNGLIAYLNDLSYGAVPVRIHALRFSYLDVDRGRSAGGIGGEATLVLQR